MSGVVWGQEVRQGAFTLEDAQAVRSARYRMRSKGVDVSSQHGDTAAVLEEHHYGMASGSEYQVCNTRLSLQQVNAFTLLEKRQCLQSKAVRCDHTEPSR